MRYAGRTPGSSLLRRIWCGEWFELPRDVEADVCVECSIQSIERITKLVSDAEFFQSVGLS
jgi:hypothetical protein